MVGAFYNKSDDTTHFSANVKQYGENTPAFYYNNLYAFYYNTLYFGPSAPTSKWWDGVYNTELEQVAVFGEVGFDITDWFNLTVGGRWFDIQQDRTLENGTLVATSTPFTVQGPAINCDPLPNPPHPLVETEEKCWTGARNIAGADEDGFVPKVTTTFNVTDDHMLYLTYSEGFRRGGGNAARPASVFGRPPLDTYESDLVKNYEGGFKTTWFDNQLQFNLTAYHMVWEDMQIEAEDPTEGIFTLGTVNLSESEIDGVEAFLNWAPLEGLSLTANVGWNDGELSETAVISDDNGDPLVELEKGTELPLVPDWKASVVADYSFSRDLWGTTPSLYLAYNYTGDSVSSLEGIQSIEVVSPVREQPSYSIVNFRAAVDGETWTASFFIDNLFDEYAKQYYNDRWIQTRLSVNQPRTYGISYRKRFQ